MWHWSPTRTCCADRGRTADRATGIPGASFFPLHAAAGTSPENPPFQGRRARSFWIRARIPFQPAFAADRLPGNWKSGFVRRAMEIETKERSSMRKKITADGLWLENRVLRMYLGPGGRVIVPDGVRALAPRAFCMKENLNEVRLPDTLEEIGQDAFWKSGLKRIVIPESVQVIQREAFACPTLEEVSMPVSILDIQMEDSVFSDCRISRTTLTGEFRTPVPWEAKESRMDFWNRIRPLWENASFFWAPQIPWEGIPSRGNPEFARLKDTILISFAEQELAGVPMPEEVRELYLDQIRKRRKRIWMAPPAFRLLLERNLIPIQDLDALLSEADSRNDIAKKAELLDYQQRMFTPEQREREQERKWKHGLQIRTPGPARLAEMRLREIWNIGPDRPNGECTMTAYMGKESDLTVPDRIGKWKVTAIGEDAFSTWRRNDPLEEELRQVRENLRYVRLPEGIRTINNRAFLGCRNLEEIRIPDATDRLGAECFQGCEKLTEIRIPDGVQILNRRTFESCKMLRTVRLPEGLRSIGEEAFRSCNSLETVILPDGVEKLGKSCFRNCRSLREIRMPEGLRKIPDWAFTGDVSLTALTLPDHLQEIGSNSFEFCRALQEIQIPGGVSEIGADAFAGCLSLNRVVLAEGVKEIRRGAFENCPSLTTIRFPASLEKLDEDAFFRCSSLQKVVFAAGGVRLRRQCLSACKQLREVTLPGSQAEALLKTLLREHPDITLFVPRDSDTAEYARQNGFPVTLI